MSEQLELDLGPHLEEDIIEANEVIWCAISLVVLISKQAETISSGDQC